MFEYGTIGDLFFIILKGSVRVLVPNKEKMAAIEREKSMLKKSNNKPLEAIAEDEGGPTASPVAKARASPRPNAGKNRRRSTLMKGFVNTLGNNAIKELLDEPIFDQVARFGAGKSFGELALRTTKPRAARIVCETPCEFACMQKDDYAKVLQKIEERLANDMIDFLQSIPLFSSWSRNLLLKLLYKVEKKSFIKKQVVVKEGDPLNQVWIIQKGEYEVSSKIEEKKEFHMELTEKLQGKNYLQKFLQPKQSHLSLLGVGQLINEDDLLEGVRNFTANPHLINKSSIGVSSVTVTCNSLNGS